MFGLRTFCVGRFFHSSHSKSPRKRGTKAIASSSVTVQSKNLPPSTGELRSRRYPRKPYWPWPQINWPQVRPIGVWCNDAAQINAEPIHLCAYKADTSSDLATPSDQADLQSTAGSGNLTKRRFYILVALWWCTLCFYSASTKAVFVYWGLKFRGVTSKRILSFRSIK
jgi:hypothetical protein